MMFSINTEMDSVTSKVVRGWQMFWFDEKNEIGANRALFNVLFYFMLATDVYLYSEDPCFSAAQEGFALAKLPRVYALLFGGPLHNAVLVGLWQTCCFFCLCSAFGVFPELSRLCAALLYSIAYFGTTLDMYQHHYLLCLILWVLVFSADTTGDLASRARHWPYRLLAVQMSLVYLFAAFTKFTDSAIFVTGGYAPAFSMVRQIHHGVSVVAHVVGVGEPLVWRAMALSVVAAELFLGFSLPFALRKRTTLCTTVAVLGIGLHGVFHFAGSLSIRLFSVYMIIFYMLFLPDFSRWIHRYNKF